MQSKSETGATSLKLIKLFTSWQPNTSSLSSASLLNQESGIMDTSYKSISEATIPARKFGKLNRTMSISYIYKQEDPHSITSQRSLLGTSLQQKVEARSRISSQVIPKSQLNRQASKIRLEQKVQEAEQKLQEMKLGFKRRVQEKRMIVKEDQAAPPQIKISLKSH